MRWDKEKDLTVSASSSCWRLTRVAARLAAPTSNSDRHLLSKVWRNSTTPSTLAFLAHHLNPGQGCIDVAAEACNCKSPLSPLRLVQGLLKHLLSTGAVREGPWVDLLAVEAYAYIHYSVRPVPKLPCR